MAGFTRTQASVAHYDFVGGTNVVSAGLGATPTAGNVVCVGIFFYDAGTTPPTFSVQDANGKTYTNGLDSGATFMDRAGWAGSAWIIVPSGAHATVTVTFNKNFTLAGLMLTEFTPPASTTATHDNNAVTTGTGAINGPTVTVSGTHDLTYAYATNENNDGVASAPWTDDYGQGTAGDLHEYQLDVASNQTAAMTGGGVGQAWCCVAMSFSSSGGGGGFTAVNRRSLGPRVGSRSS